MRRIIGIIAATLALMGGGVGIAAAATTLYSPTGTNQLPTYDPDGRNLALGVNYDLGSGTSFTANAVVTKNVTAFYQLDVQVEAVVDGAAPGTGPLWVAGSGILLYQHFQESAGIINTMPTSWNRTYNSASWRFAMCAYNASTDQHQTLAVWPGYGVIGASAQNAHPKGWTDGGCPSGSHS